MPNTETDTVAAIIREQKPGLKFNIIPRAYNDFSIILQPVGNETPHEMFRRLSDFLKSYNAAVMRQAIFGDVSYYRESIDALASLCGPIEWPVTWIQGGSCTEAKLAGTIVKAVSGADISRIQIDGKPVGSIIESRHARFCHLADIHAADISAPNNVQTEAMFEQMRTALAAADMQMTDIVRTWFCLDEILNWYNDFNTVRTSIFRKYGVFDKVVPASTGIGGTNASGAAIIADALAVTPRNNSVRFFSVPSPLQCPAIDYGSSFSRAAELTLPDFRYLYISGTASIDPDGQTMHVGDMNKQVDQTFQVINAILQSRGMAFSDVTRGIAYCRNREDAAVYEQYCHAHGYENLPVIIAHSTVCRDNLLFELQVDSVIPAGK